MIQLGDTVREVGNDQLLEVVGYRSAGNLFQVQLPKQPITARYVPGDKLEFVSRPQSESSPGFYPSTPIMDDTY
jgi:hypothetical protein